MRLGVIRHVGIIVGKMRSRRVGEPKLQNLVAFLTYNSKHSDRHRSSKYTNSPALNLFVLPNLVSFDKKKENMEQENAKSETKSPPYNVVTKSCLREGINRSRGKPNQASQNPSSCKKARRKYPMPTHDNWMCKDWDGIIRRTGKKLVDKTRK